MCERLCDEPSIFSKLISVIFFPFRYCFETVNSIYCLSTSRPIFAAFICFTFTLMCLAVYNKKIQDMLLSIPYDKILHGLTNQTMIAVYLSFMEIMMELFMTVIFAGVSVIVTAWLLFEDSPEQRPKINLRKNYSSRENIPYPPYPPRPLSRKDPKVICSTTRLRYAPKEVEVIKSFN